MSDEKQTATNPCDACGCPIQFIKGQKGKYIPVQKVRVIYRRDGLGVLVKIEDLAGELFVSHYETCSDPNRFSRVRQGRE